MPVYDIQFNMAEKDFKWLIERSTEWTDDRIKDFEENLLEKIRRLRATRHPFRFQKDLLALVHRLARMYIDFSFVNDKGRPVLSDTDRSLIRLALAYFIKSNDRIKDNSTFFGYLDDYLLIGLVAKRLETHLDRYEKHVRRLLENRAKKRKRLAAKTRAVGA